MIIERLILKEYNWAITVLFLCSCNDIKEIVDILDSIDCPYTLIDEAKSNLITCNSNTGLTYSNFALGRTVMVINKTDSIKELLNTLTHECYHFICLLSRARYINEEEELATLTGRFNMNCWEIIRDIYDK